MLRNPWFRIATTLGAILIVLLLAASIRFAVSRGVFASVKPVTSGQCKVVEGVSQVAALAPAPGGQTVYIATRQGEVFQYFNGVRVKLSGVPKDFHPLAMSVTQAAHEDAKLAVVFARSDGSYTLAAFDVQPGKLAETGLLTTDRFADPAGLAGVPGGAFYLVNRHGSHSGLGRWLDDVFLLPRAKVLYYDGMKFVPVAERLNSPGGIALSPDGSHLYVGQQWPRTIASFTRNDFTGALDDAALLDLPAGPRQITLAPDGSLIVAAAPKPGAGAVYRVRVRNGVPQSAELLYASKNEEVTAAAQTDEHLLIGTGDKLLDCKP